MICNPHRHWRCLQNTMFSHIKTAINLISDFPEVMSMQGNRKCEQGLCQICTRQEPIQTRVKSLRAERGARCKEKSWISGTEPGCDVSEQMPHLQRWHCRFTVISDKITCLTRKVWLHGSSPANTSSAGVSFISVWLGLQSEQWTASAPNSGLSYNLTKPGHHDAVFLQWFKQQGRN